MESSSEEQELPHFRVCRGCLPRKSVKHKWPVHGDNVIQGHTYLQARANFFGDDIVLKKARSDGVRRKEFEEVLP
jgi:hypothetical protein